MDIQIIQDIQANLKQMRHIQANLRLMRHIRVDIRRLMKTKRRLRDEE